MQISCLSCSALNWEFKKHLNKQQSWHNKQIEIIKIFMNSLLNVATLKNSWKMSVRSLQNICMNFSGLSSPQYWFTIFASHLRFSSSGSVFIYLKLGIIIAKVAIWNIFVLFCFPLASFRFVLLCCCCCFVVLCAGLSFSKTRKLGILGKLCKCVH